MQNNVAANSTHMWHPKECVDFVSYALPYKYFKFAKFLGKWQLLCGTVRGENHSHRCYGVVVAK
jgi:hypothetical protein